MGTYNILHLSDLHIREEAREFDTLVDNLGDKLKREKIDVVIFTGDIFQKPPVKGSKGSELIDEEKKAELIKKAVSFFEKLLKYLKLGNPDLEKRNFWFVAGNHDLYRQKDIDTWSLYDGFLEKFYNNDKPVEYNDKHMILKIDSEHQKILMGFDSNIDDNYDYDKDPDNYFSGHITIDQLRKAKAYFEGDNEYQDYDKIAFFHHPCDMFEERAHSNIDGIINNSRYVFKELEKWNVKLILHGHKHWAKASINRPHVGQKIYMFAGGVIGGSRDICSGNIIEIDNKSKEIYLKEIVSRNIDEFVVEPVDIPDKYMEGLLFDAIKESWSDLKDHDEEKNIVKMIDKLYLSYEQLNVLLHSKNSLWFFKNSIKYGLGIKDIDNDLPENIDEVKWKKVEAILGDSEIPSNVRDSLQNDLTERRHVAFALLGVFFTDLYRAIRKIDSIIWSKPKTEFNLGTCSYYIYLKLRVDADGDAVQQELDNIMEKFQLRLYEIQDFLYCIKLNIKNIFIELRNGCNQIRHCDFDASVSRLIQLLTGTNIYCHEYSFVRELIQNSIDAVSFGEKQNLVINLDAPISIELGDCEKKEKYFKIRDYGIGMKREIIERYFTTLGRSYYKEYAERRSINYNSVSNFGIGFLSVFKPCHKIIIKTRHYLEQECYNLNINSNCGHYTIFSNSQTEFPAGTEIICYFKNPDVEYQKIISYIKEIMLDIKYNIKISYDVEKEQKEQLIKARKIRDDDNNVIFIPFDEDNNRVTALSNRDGKEWKDILKKALKDDVKRYRHGILISARQKENAGVDVLSAGILLKNAGLQDVFREEIGEGTEETELQHMKVTLNFPPNWLDIDVSREKVNGIRIDYFKTVNGIQNINSFKEEICKELKKQVWKVFDEIKNIPLFFFKEACMLVKALEQSNKGNEEQNVCMWNLKLCFEGGKIKFYLNHKGEENESDWLFHKWVLKISFEYSDDTCERNHKTTKLIFKNLPHDEISAIYYLFQKEKNTKKSREVLQKLGLDTDGVDDQQMPLVPAFFLDEEYSQENIHEEKELHQFIESAVWESCTVEHIEKSNGLFSVWYDDLEHNKLISVSDRLKHRVDILIKRYNNISLDQQSNTYSYDFVWTYIIINALIKCGLGFKGDDVQITLQKRYENLRDTIKILYFRGDELLLDIYTIASCYMSVLMDIPKESLDYKDVKEDAKYRWIFNVGLGLLYMWILTGGENSESDMSEKKRSEMLFELYKQKELDSFLDNDIVERYIQLLAAHEKKTFDILCFAELLHGIDDNIRKKLD